MKEKFIFRAGFEPASPCILVRHDIHYIIRSPHWLCGSFIDVSRSDVANPRRIRDVCQKSLVSDLHLSFLHSKAFVAQSLLYSGSVSVLVTVRTLEPWTLDISLYIFLVTIECGLDLLIRVFNVFTLTKCETCNIIHHKKSHYFLIVKKKCAEKCQVFTVRVSLL